MAQSGSKSMETRTNSDGMPKAGKQHSLPEPADDEAYRYNEEVGHS